MVYDKKLGVYVAKDPEDREENEFFEVEEAGEGEQFMAVKPWIGAIMEPDNHPQPNPSPPDVRYKVDYVYGYRSHDTRQNVYFNQNGQAIFMSAALGVILDH